VGKSFTQVLPLWEFAIAMQLTLQQVEQFLREVRGLSLPSSAESLLATALANNAQVARDTALHCFGVTLPIDPSGVAVLDDLLNSMHHAMRPSFTSRLFGRRISSADSDAVAASLGAHLCQLVQPHVGGEWGFADYLGSPQFVLILAPGNFMAVAQKAGKQFVSGESESVKFFFGLAGAVSRGRARIAAMSSTERQALKDKVVARRVASKARKASITAMSKEEKDRWAKSVQESAQKRIAAARAKRESVG
jgi:hypothetical protein